MHIIIGEIDMGQKITVTLNSKRYELTASTPEDEEIYRLAAVSVNNGINSYSVKFQGKEVSEILAMVAFNESIGRISAMKEIEKDNKSADSLRTMLNTYLDNIEK